MELRPTDAPDPDATLEPAGFMVEGDGGDRIHFLDWGGPPPTPTAPGIVAIHGLGQTGWIWAPVARRLAGSSGPRRFVTLDLRGHGLSDAPTEDGRYDLDVLAGDAVAVAEGAGLLSDSEADRIVLAGHGFGAIVAARAAADLGARCAGLVLVDGGWETLEATTGVDADEFLRGLDEPPEVMRSLAAFLADRKAFDPGTWDADQEHAASATIVETHAGRVVPSARPHATEASVRTMFAYDPGPTLAAVSAPIAALIAGGDESGSRVRQLAEASATRVASGRDPIAISSFAHDGHNLMRYRPREVAAAILSVAG
jgi:pimeloyl-ACP methyl ester carboxylesterase